ncbi:MAG: hypothetical protein APR63_10110 [Desulfuromonas sp. SDB]|nr:MAG: hypothetical protein APR63_10110 [Desulfuromonas sp. SDB]
MGIIAAVVLLGILILVHELGHFAAARLFKVSVPKFSIGFGPRLTGFKAKGTDFAISAVPLGGYIKMKGEMEINDREKSEQRDYEQDDFRSKALWKKAIIVISGPLANILFAWLFIFTADVVMRQEYIPTTEIGRVIPGSSADIAGLRSGDEIIEIDGVAVREWFDVETELWSKTSDSVAILKISSTPCVETSLVVIPPDSSDSFYRGLSPMIAPVVGKVFGDPAIQAGLKVKDEIVWFIPVTSQLGELVDQSPTFFEDSVNFYGIEVMMLDTVSFNYFPLDSEYVDNVNLIPACKVEYWYDIGTLISAQQVDSFKLVVNREDHFKLITVNSVQNIENRKVIGIMFELPSRAMSIPQAFKVSVQQLKLIFYLIFKLPQMIITKQISIRESVGGPIRIFQETSKAARMGWDTLLFIAGFISLNLGFFNLFPVMPLDGGHLLIYVIEGVIRRPVPAKIIRGFQVFGMSLLLVLIVLVTANDLVNVLFK